MKRILYTDHKLRTVLIAQQEEQRRQRIISEAWIHTHTELQKQAESIKSVHDRKLMAESVNSLETSYIAAMNSGNVSEANSVVEELRKKILSVPAPEIKLISGENGFSLHIKIWTQKRYRESINEDIDKIVTKVFSKHKIELTQL